MHTFNILSSACSAQHFSIRSTKIVNSGGNGGSSGSGNRGSFPGFGPDRSGSGSDGRGGIFKGQGRDNVSHLYHTTYCTSRFACGSVTPQSIFQFPPNDDRSRVSGQTASSGPLTPGFPSSSNHVDTSNPSPSSIPSSSSDDQPGIPAPTVAVNEFPLHTTTPFPDRVSVVIE